MLRTLRFFSILLVLVVVGLVGGALDMAGRETKVGLELRQPAAEQEQAVRRWRPLRFEKDLVLGAAGKEAIELPFVVRTGPRGDVFVLDLGDRSIKRFDARGKLIRRIGGETRNRPSGFLRPTDFAVDDAGGVCVADVGAAELACFHPDGERSRTLKLESAPLRVLRWRGGILVESFAPAETLFQHYSEEGDLTSSFGALVEDQEENFAALEGWVTASGGGGFSYASYHAGVLAKYGDTGELVYLRQTIDPVPAPVLDVDRNGIRRVDRSSLNSAFGIGVWRDQLYVVTTSDGSPRLRELIDFYDDASGDYRHSIRLPAPSRFAFLDDRHLYTVEQHTVTRWTLRKDLERSSM